MKSPRTARRLRMDLLQARGAAHRIELTLAVQQISDQFNPLRRVVDSIASVAGVLGDHARAASWAGAAVAALTRGRGWPRAVLGLISAVLMVRRARRSARARSGKSDPTQASE